MAAAAFVGCVCQRIAHKHHHKKCETNKSRQTSSRYKSRRRLGNGEKKELRKEFFAFSINKWCCCDSLAPHYLQNAMRTPVSYNRIRNAHNIKQNEFINYTSIKRYLSSRRQGFNPSVRMVFAVFVDACFQVERRAHVSMIKMADCIHFECNSFFHV